VLRHDADRSVCMAVELRIAGNVLGVGCVPSRRSDRCTWWTLPVDRDGKRAWCQVRPARRIVHGWATPTRSRPERYIPAAQLIRSGPRCSCGDGLSASLARRLVTFGGRCPDRTLRPHEPTCSQHTPQEVGCVPREARRMPQQRSSRAALPKCNQASSDADSPSPQEQRVAQQTS